MGYNCHKRFMKKFLSLLVVALCGLIITSCSDRNSPNASQQSTKKYGYIQVLNNSSDPYTISIKGNTSMSFTLNGKQSVTKTVEVGYYNVHVRQQSGYLLYPTEKDYEFYVKENKTSIVSFDTTL